MTHARAQDSWSPYPIIYIHGLDSEDKAWHESIEKLSVIHGSFVPNSASNTGNVFNAMLNRYDDMTAMFGPNNVPGDIDDDVYTQTAALQPGSVFALNFNTGWNDQLASMIFYQDQWFLGSRESQSNEAAIVKQGYALKKCIEAVLRATGAKKVILVGHSMGGLCIREYLQRRVNGTPRWWVEPGLSDGHKVARVVTYGTPHWGSDASIFVPMAQNDSGQTSAKGSEAMIPLVPNTSSEAVRDLRYSYLVGSQMEGVYLFGGNEAGLNTSVLLSGWHNADVDCNGNDKDIVIGINNDLITTMPMNIRYTWITAKPMAVTQGDGVVYLEDQRIMGDDGRPWPVGLADTLFTNRFHWDQTSDAASIARGLDEPEQMALAYDIEVGETYRGGISMQMDGVQTDNDCFRIPVQTADSQRRRLNVKIRDLNPTRRELSIALIDEARSVFKESVDYHSQGTTLSIPYETLLKRQGEMYVVVSGVATSDGLQSPYELSSWYDLSSNRSPEIAAIRDTSMKQGTSLSIALQLEDESLASLAIKAHSSNKDVVRDADIVVNGAGASRTLQITPTGVERGVTTISVDASDSEYTTTRQFQLRVDDATGVANESEQQHLLHLHIYPSIASTNAQLILEVDKEVQTNVELMTHTGELVTTLYSGLLRQGSHNFPVSLAQFSSGLYWVRVVSGRTTINSPIMVVK
jgi:pimeloyl-ACP methyl ester carboxylesterase